MKTDLEQYTLKAYKGTLQDYKDKINTIETLKKEIAKRNAEIQRLKALPKKDGGNKSSATNNNNVSPTENKTPYTILYTYKKLV